MSPTRSAESRHSLTAARSVVVKIGTAVLTRDGQGLDRAAISSWVAQMAALHQRGLRLVLVTSGSIAAGMQRLKRRTRPRALYEQQAMAAVGQMELVQAYESSFQKFGLHTAQILLTHDDLGNRQRYLNARSTLLALLRLGVIPVVNENDTVATDEIRFGDNDTLAALVVNLVEADLLVILTDQPGLLDRNPRLHDEATLIPQANVGDPRLAMVAGGSGVLGRGGMRTKLLAAEKAARSGAGTVIASGRDRDVLLRIVGGEQLGTYLKPTQGRIAARKQWLASHLQVRGKLFLDEGAARVIRDAGKSLLPVGVRAVEGDFARGEIVSCVDPQGSEVARGLVNYDATESTRIIGHPSDEIEAILGYVDEPELIHRDNMVLM
ncbi:MAG: glutamate 5-kinase [Gammaproteobacteria bacterium]|nr:MAG: glutamate 5-kinase [Gammaproteobacteria bacterium]